MVKKDDHLHPCEQETLSPEFSAQEFSASQNDTVSTESDHADDVNVLASAGLISTIEALWNNLQSVVQDQLQLAVLETLRVGKSLVAIVVYTLVIALLMASAWLCAVGALVLWFIHNGMNASVALLLAVMINVVGVMVFMWAIVRHSRALRFPATVNTLSIPFQAMPSSATQRQSER